jgi:hypothetical protein
MPLERNRNKGAIQPAALMLGVVFILPANAAGRIRATATEEVPDPSWGHAEMPDSGLTAILYGRT